MQGETASARIGYQVAEMLQNCHLRFHKQGCPGHDFLTVGLRKTQHRFVHFPGSAEPKSLSAYLGLPMDGDSQPGNMVGLHNRTNLAGLPLWRSHSRIGKRVQPGISLLKPNDVLGKRHLSSVANVVKPQTPGPGLL